MNEVINLKRVRKAKARAADEAIAAFGRSKSEKSLAKTQQEAADRKLDGHKRHDNDTDI